MKNLIYFFTLTLLFSISVGSALATMFRVKNSLTENIPGGLFTTIQRTHDHFSVKNDDTLMGEGSAKNYDHFSETLTLLSSLLSTLTDLTNRVHFDGPTKLPSAPAARS